MECAGESHSSSAVLTSSVAPETQAELELPQKLLTNLGRKARVLSRWLRVGFLNLKMPKAAEAALRGC
jgi:hypothetical protein